MSDFLPSDYKIPSTSNWMTLTQGDNRFRVLGGAKIGYEYWVTIKGEDGKPTRKPKRVDMETDINVGEIEEGQSISHFWAIPVYNFDDKRIQILVIKQKTIQQMITKLTNNPKWGSPLNYNLVISKEGDIKENTRYLVSPEPKDPEEEKFLEGIKKKYKEMDIDMMQIYISKEHPYGGDPFLKSTEVNLTPEEIAALL